MILTLALLLINDFGAYFCQTTLNFNKSESLETITATAIKYCACFALIFFNYNPCRPEYLKVYPRVVHPLIPNKYSVE